MNRRERNIVYTLIKQSKFHKNSTIQDLMEAFQVSQRTIRYDLEAISEFFVQRKLRPLDIDNNGNVILPAQMDQIISIMQENDFYSFKLNKEERIDMISFLLCTTQDCLTLQYFADLLFVSRSTAIHDVEAARQELQDYDAKIDAVPRGLLLDVKESNRRILIVNLLRKQHVLYYYREHFAKNFISKQDEAILRKIIREAEISNHLFLTDESFEDLLIYLMIVLEEQNKQRCVEIDYSVSHISFMDFSEDILHSLNAVFDVEHSLQERYLLCDILYNLNYLKRNDVDESMMQIQVAAKQFIDAITKDLNINLRNDFQFYQNLTNHLQSTFKDIQTGAGSEEVLLKEVVKKNASIVSIICKHLAPLEGIVQRKLSSEEIAYITIHVCAAIERNRYDRPTLSVLLVCNSGIGTSQLLLSRLKKYFHFHVVDVLPSHALVSYDVSSIDLIISTIPINETRCEVINLHPYLTDEDCLALGEKVEQIKSKQSSTTNLGFLKLQTTIANSITKSKLDKDEIYKNIISDLQDYFYPQSKQTSPTLSELLKGHVRIDVEASNWEEAILQSAKPLFEEGYFNRFYMNQMIENVKANGPYIVLSKGFALPHESPEMGSTRLGMYLIRLKKPVLFHSELYDPVEFVCCLSTLDKDSHLKAMFNLMNLLAKPSFLDGMRKAKNADDLYALINESEEML